LTELATTNQALNDVVNTIRGPKGTSVTLTILHKDSQTPQDIKIVRDTITVKSVDGWVKDVKDIGGIKVPGNQDRKNCLYQAFSIR
jgi:C-terminal processing protease CtpA/Prc